jgi:hypothetical protein
MKLNNDFKRFIFIFSTIILSIAGLGLIFRMLLIHALRDVFGPPRDKLLEPSIYAHLTTTCFDDATLMTCEVVSIDVIRDRIQPELNKFNLTFVDYIDTDRLKFGEIIRTPYDTLLTYDKQTNYLWVEFHRLIAIDENQQHWYIYVFFEMIKGSDITLFQYPFYTSLNYQGMLDVLESNIGDSVIFDFDHQHGGIQTYRVTLSQHMFRPFKTLHPDDQNVIRLYVHTSIERQTTEGWIPYMNPIESTYGIMIVYDGHKISIYRHDAFIIGYDLLFEYQASLES